jgi:hypothetical protein
MRFVFAHLARPSQPAPNVRDDRETPLLEGRGPGRLVEVICPTAQAEIRVSHWHDGQITSDASTECQGEAGFLPCFGRAEVVQA